MDYKKTKVDLKKVYDDLAQDWGKSTLDTESPKRIKKFIDLLGGNSKKKVLDLGCGAGLQTQQMVGEGFHVIGVDLSPQMIAEAKRRVPEAEFNVADITNLKFTSSSFDAVLAKDSLLHVPKVLIPQTLNKMHNILKNGGFIYITVKEGRGEKVVSNEKYGAEVNRFFSFFQQDEIENFLKQAGFKLLSSDDFKRPGKEVVWIEIIARK